MRYLHYEAQPIRDYMQSRHLVVTKCDFENKHPPIEDHLNSIEEMLKRSETLWGAALPYFCYISGSFEANAPSLAKAVPQVEATSDADRFLIVAYQDAGLISISGVELPFQKGARDGKWWAPYRSASRSER